MRKTIIEYSIPIQSEEQVEKHNKMREEMFGSEFIPYKTTEEHAEILTGTLLDAIQEVGDEGGWYLGDDIKVKIELEYIPENK